jgi:hypothetical protein
MNRLYTALISFGAAMVILFVLNAALVGGSESANLLVNKSGEKWVWFSEQAFMWIFFCLGAGELLLRFNASSREIYQVQRKILPEDESVVLTAKELPEVYRRAKVDPARG